MKAPHLALFIFLFLFSCQKAGNNQQAPKNEDLTGFVDPFIGTSGHGHTFPGAALPFGMVQLSPDTGVEGWDWCSGYHASDSSIIGFSHTHLSGTGRSDAMDIMLMPITGALQTSPGTKQDPDAGYRSRFSHSKEQASPGFYKVFLEDYGIGVELSATRRCGFHKYAIPKGKEAHVVIDLFHSFSTDLTQSASIQVVNDSVITGSRRSRGWGEPGERDFVEHQVFFAAKFSTPFTSSGIIVDDRNLQAEKQGTGKSVKGYATFAAGEERAVLVKVGISFVDAAGAIKNLDEEIPHWDFARVREDARRVWNQELAVVKADFADDADKRIFYTALYHSYLAPFLNSDSDGRYTGFDRKIHNADGGEMYTGFSLWDTFRATHPLYTILQAERVPAFIRSMLTQYEQTSILPVWPLFGSETNCMIGYHSVPVIADAWMKGITGFDTLKAYEAMKAAALQDNGGLKHLRQFNFVPSELEKHSVSKTLEYSFDDWCIAQIAKKLGKTDDEQYFNRRSEAYLNVFDSSVGFMRGKKADGSFNEKFDPSFASYGYTDFIEGNSWQYSFFVPHAVNKLVEVSGGAQKFEQKLDGLFTATAKEGEQKPIDISGLIGEYAHGNEPSHHVAYLYSCINRPEKTQRMVRQIMSTLYTDKRDGLCGNEDMGQMSSWYVFSALGFYPVNPADQRYILGSPVVSNAVISLPGGKAFRIVAKNNGRSNIYVRSVTLNNKPLTGWFISHDDIMNGGELVFEMASEPPGSQL